MKKLAIVSILVAIVVSAILIGYLGLALDSDNAPTPKTLDIPPILTADAGNGRFLMMNIVGIEGIPPDQQIPISSFKWNIGSAPEPEITTDKFGRVKVQFCWDREGKTADSSCWIRVSTPWAGKNWGFIHIPRIGQEVIVNFIEGDPDRPITARIIASNARIIQTSYILSDESPPRAEYSFEFDTIKWEFIDVNGDSFCAGLDVQRNQILDCQPLLDQP